MSIEEFGIDFGTPTSSETSSHDHTFEGPEKNLEIDFIKTTETRGCRLLTRPQLEEMLEAAECRILSHIGNDVLDSYVLSESSLFVYSHKIIIKTCGTTTLLKCLPILLQATTALGLQVEWLSYSRKNYSFPQTQRFPHTSFHHEVQYLNATLPYFPGHAYVLGPVTSDHWLMYVWDNCDLPADASTDRTFHVLMQDLDPSVAALFYQQPVASATESDRMTQESGIRRLLPTAQLDDCAFDPCGYSMNAIEQEAYHTIHITPESHCSYASYETNATPPCYVKLLSQVLAIFRPKRFTMTLYADQGGLASLQSDVFSQEQVLVTHGTCQLYYKRTCTSETHFEGDYQCNVGNYVLKHQD